MQQEEINTIREIWKIADPKHASSREVGEAIIINKLLDEIDSVNKVKDDIRLFKMVVRIEVLNAIKCAKKGKVDRALQWLHIILKELGEEA